MKRIIFLYLLLFAFTSCHKGNESASPRPGGSLRIGIFHKLSEINPLTTDATFSANLLELLFSTLVRRSARGEILPELAISWEGVDGKVWTFHLRKDVFFHNGERLTSKDLKFTYDKMRLSRNSGYGQFFHFVEKIEAPDDETLRIFLTRSDPALWIGLSLAGIGPKNLMEEDTLYQSFNEKPIGSGPYRFVSRSDTDVVLEANRNYFGEKPFLNQIIIRIFPGQEANLSRLIAGDIDLLFLLNPKDYGAISQVPCLRVYDNWYPLLYLISFNQKTTLFASPRVRQALNLAVNRQGILNKTLQGKGYLAAVSVPPDSPDYDSQIGVYPYDPNEALRLLKEDGWSRTRDARFLKKRRREFRFSVDTIRGEDLNDEILRRVQADLSEIGIQMEVQFHSSEEYVEKVYRHKAFEASIAYFVFRFFYDNNFNLWHSSQIRDGFNFTSYNNPRIDALLETVRLDSDPARRASASREFQKILHDDPPGIFLFWRNMPIAVHRRFRGFPEKQMESLRDLIHVWDGGDSS